MLVSSLYQAVDRDVMSSPIASNYHLAQHRTCRLQESAAVVLTPRGLQATSRASHSKSVQTNRDMAAQPTPFTDLVSMLL